MNVRRLRGSIISLAILATLVGFVVFTAHRNKDKFTVTPAEQARVAEYEAKRQASHAAKAQAEYEQAIATHKFWVGMSTEDLVRSLGQPERKTVAADANGKVELWHYSSEIMTIYEGKLVRYIQSR